METNVVYMTMSTAVPTFSLKLQSSCLVINVKLATICDLKSGALSTEPEVRRSEWKEDQARS